VQRRNDGDVGLFGLAKAKQLQSAITLRAGRPGFCGSSPLRQ
jgi:hypothetical protein